MGCCCAALFVAPGQAKAGAIACLFGSDKGVRTQLLPGRRFYAAFETRPVSMRFDDGEETVRLASVHGYDKTSMSFGPWLMPLSKIS